MQVSIDFGTTNSCVAWFNSDTLTEEVIAIGGEAKVPSLVFLAEKAADRKFGNEAFILSKDSEEWPDEERLDFTSRLARSFKSDFAEGEKHVRSVHVGARVRPDDVVGAYLAWLLGEVRAKAGLDKSEPISLTITHPATEAWSAIGEDSPANRLAAQARNAGFAEVRTELEPLAAFREIERRELDLGNGVLVFDLGGGTLDMAYFKRDPEGRWGLPFVSGTGVSNIAGDAFDGIVERWLDSEVEKKTDGAADIRSVVGAERRAREAKEDLSQKSETTISLFVRPKEGRPRRLVLPLRRETFEKAAEELFGKIESALEDYVSEIRRKGGKVDKVLLIGGSTNIPKVQEIVRRVTGAECLRPDNADSLVALGGVEIPEISTWNLPTLSETGWNTKLAARVAKMADAGNPDAQFQMGMRYLYGFVDKHDSKRAYEMFAAAHESGHVLATFFMYKMMKYGLGTEISYDGADAKISELDLERRVRELAENGNPDAMFALAEHHYSEVLCDGMEIYGSYNEYPETFEDFVACCFRNNVCIDDVSLKASFSWHRYATDQCHTLSCRAVGFIWERWGYREHAKQCFEWAMERGDSAASFGLALCLSLDTQAFDTREKASRIVSLFEEAAEMGNPFANYLLATTLAIKLPQMGHKRTGAEHTIIQKNYRDCACRMIPDADAGHYRYMGILADLFGNGWGVERDSGQQKHYSSFAKLYREYSHASYPLPVELLRAEGLENVARDTFRTHTAKLVEQCCDSIPKLSKSYDGAFWLDFFIARNLWPGKEMPPDKVLRALRDGDWIELASCFRCLAVYPNDNFDPCAGRIAICEEYVVMRGIKTVPNCKMKDGSVTTLTIAQSMFTWKRINEVHIGSNCIVIDGFLEDNFEIDPKTKFALAILFRSLIVQNSGTGRVLIE